MPIVTNLEKQVNKQKKFPTSKKIGIILLVIATIGYIGLFIRWIPFLHDFLVGTFGLFSYVMFLAMYFIGAALLKGAKYVYSRKYVFYLCLALISVLSIFHIAFTFSADLTTYGGYLSQVYTSGLSVGGLLLGLLVYPLQKYMYSIGAIFFFLVLLAISIWLIYDYLTRIRHLKNIDTKIFSKKVEKQNEQKTTTISFETNNNKTKIGLDAEIEKEQQNRQYAINKLGLSNSIKNEHFVDNKQLNSFASDFINQKQDNEIFSNDREYAKQQSKPTLLKSKLEPPSDYSGSFGYNMINSKKQKPKTSNYDKNKEFLDMTIKPSSYIPPKNNISEFQVESNEKNIEKKQFSNADFLNANFNDYKGAEQTFSRRTKNTSNEYSNNYNTTSNSKDITQKRCEENSNISSNYNNNFDNSKQENYDNNLNNNGCNDNKNNENIDNQSSKYYENENQSSENLSDSNKDNESKIEEIDLKNFELPPSLMVSSENSRRRRMVKHNKNQSSLFNVDAETENKKEVHKYSRYIYPTVNLLTNVSTDASNYNEDCEVNAIAIEKTLNNFGIAVKVINTVVGPAVTRYEIDMPAGISVNRVVQYSNDIAMAVASSHGVRIQAPIPGKSAVGIEIPNKKVAMVGIKEIVESKEFLYNKNKLSFAVGKEVSGKKIVADMHEMPHILVAGSTGSGKSVGLNTMIISMLYKYSPEELRLILVDPKQVEFFVYNGLPHLLTPEVIVDPLKALKSLNWSIDEMERRYTEFRESGVKELQEYNNLPEVKNHEKQMMPQIVIIIDEVGDIMSMPSIKKDFEEKVRRLTQKARAAGIHLVLATQRPSVDVITGVIKSNLPSRMAFAVTNYQDSRTILDAGGAEKLLGKGDMLFCPQGSEPFRVQGSYISNDEIKSVVEYVKQNNECYFDQEINETINKEEQTEKIIDDSDISDSNNGGFDPLMKEALKLIINNGCASASMLQRRFSIGNPKAARIIDQMEVAKFIGPSNGNKPRAVFITAEQFKSIFGEGIDE